MQKCCKRIVGLLVIALLICNSVTNYTDVKAGVYWAKEAEYIRIGDSVSFSRGTYDGYINPYYFYVSGTTDLSIKLFIKQFEVNFIVSLYNDDGDCLFEEYGISKGTCKYNHSTGTYDLNLNFGKLKKGTYYLEFSTFNSNYENRGNFVLKSNKSTNKKFKVSKKSIIVKKGRKKSVTVTYKYNSGSVYSTIKNKRYASTKWGKWNGDKVKLYIKGKKKGKTKIYITNSKNSKKLAITVKVI